MPRLTPTLCGLLLTACAAGSPSAARDAEHGVLVLLRAARTLSRAEIGGNARPLMEFDHTPVGMQLHVGDGTALVGLAGEADSPGRLLAIDLATATPRWSLPVQMGASVCRRPEHILLLDDKRALIADPDQPSIWLVDLTDVAVTAAMQLPDLLPADLCLDRDGNRMVIRDARSNKMSSVRLPDAVLARNNSPPHSGSRTSGHTMVSLCTGQVWTCRPGQNVVEIRDPDRMTLLHTVTTEDTPGTLLEDVGGGLVFVSCSAAGIVAAFDSRTFEPRLDIDLVAQQTEFSPLPAAMCLDQDSRLLWVACGRGEFVAVIDIARRTMIDRMPIPRGPATLTADTTMR